MIGRAILADVSRSSPLSPEGGLRRPPFPPGSLHLFLDVDDEDIVVRFNERRIIHRRPESKRVADVAVFRQPDRKSRDPVLQIGPYEVQDRTATSLGDEFERKLPSVVGT